MCEWYTTSAFERGRGEKEERGQKNFLPSLWVPQKQLPSRECVFLPAAKPSGPRAVRVVVVVVVVGREHFARA